MHVSHRRAEKPSREARKSSAHFASVRGIPSTPIMTFESGHREVTASVGIAAVGRRMTRRVLVSLVPGPIASGAPSPPTSHQTEAHRPRSWLRSPATARAGLLFSVGPPHHAGICHEALWAPNPEQRKSHCTWNIA